MANFLKMGQRKVTIVGNRLLSNLMVGYLLLFCCRSNAEESLDNKDEQKIIKVCTLNSVQANQEFQHNVQLLKLQRQQLVELKAQLDATNDETTKVEIQHSIDELLKKLNENNELMFKTYGFSLNRNYTMVIEKSHIYMMLSDVEAKQFEEEQSKRGLTEESEE